MMKRFRRLTAGSRRGSALLLTGLIALALTACAEETTPPAADSSSGQPAAPEESATPEESAAPAEEEASAPEPSSSPQACLVGEWLADNDLFLTQMREFGDQMQDVTGEVILVFTANGELTTRYEDWSMTAISEGIEMTIHRGGVDEGTYSVTGDTMSVTDTSVGSTVSVSGAGINMAVPAHPVHFEGAPFTCLGDAATVTTTDGVMQLQRR